MAFATTPGLSFTTGFTGTCALDDDVELRFGSNTDYWLEYRSAGTAFELNSTDVNGSGTDGIVFKVEDGTDDVDFTGHISINGVVTGTVLNLNPGRTALDLITSVGIGLNIETDTTAINAAGNGETKAIAALVYIGIPTWTSVGTTLTLTRAATLYIEGAPVGSTNTTTTDTHAIWVDGGSVRFDATLAVVGAVTTAALTASGIIKTDDSTDATSGTDGSLQTDGGLSVVKDIFAGNDILIASGGVLNFDGGDVTITHTANTLTIAGGTLATVAITCSTIVASGIVKTDDTTDATSTTDGSLQTDGGLSVTKDIVGGNDLLLTSSGSIINFNAGDMLLTHGSNVVTVSGGTWATAALTSSTGVFSGILKTDDTTAATSTTDGSLQTDGGLSVAKELVLGGIYRSITVTTLADDATPNVNAGNLFVTGGTTGITDFDLGVVGQTIHILAEHSVTINDGAPVVLNGSGNYSMTSGDTLTLTMFNDQIWHEVARSAN